MREREGEGRDGGRGERWREGESKEGERERERCESEDRTGISSVRQDCQFTEGGGIERERESKDRKGKGP